MNTGSCALSLSLGLAIAGCSTSYQDHKVTLAEAEKLAPALKPLPASVGTYYGPDFRSFAATDTHKAGSSVDRFHFRIGKTSEDYLDQVFSALFERTEKVDRLPGTADDLLSKAGRNLDGTIVARIKSASRTRVAFEFFLYDAEDRLLGSWNVSGSSGMSAATPKEVSKSLSAAIRDASAKLLVNFKEVHPVKSWLSRLGIDVMDESVNGPATIQAQRAPP